MYSLDNFLLIGPLGSPVCVQNIHLFLATCDCVGVPIAWKKLEGPTSVVTFLAIEIDSVAKQFGLTHSNLIEQRELIKE